MLVKSLEHNHIPNGLYRRHNNYGQYKIHMLCNTENIDLFTKFHTAILVK